MQGAHQPPFYPAMRFASVKIAQIERLVGHPMPLTRVAYDPSYALYGFPEEPKPADGADQAEPGKPTDGANPEVCRDLNPGQDPSKNPQQIFLSTIDPPKLT